MHYKNDFFEVANKTKIIEVLFKKYYFKIVEFNTLLAIFL